ncbi:hypothetical protein Bca4012_069217 [Brassica carinata]
MDPSNSNVAETPVSLGQNLPVDPSGSTVSLPLGPSSSTVTPSSTSNRLFGVPLIPAASLPLGPSSSTVTTPSTSNLLFGVPLIPAAASSTVTPTPDVDLSSGLPLGLPLGFNLPAAAFTSLGQSLGSQDASSSRNVTRKKRSIHFPMTRINIGNWTQTAANSRELIAKCYFTRKQFVWEILSEVETDAGLLRKQVKKMEIDWDSVLSFKAEHDCFQIELNRPPRFRTEKKDCQDIGVWKDIEHFADDHPSSTCRRHALFFDPQVLKTNFDKIFEDVFWSTVKNVQFPSLPSLLFLADEQNLLGPEDNLEAGAQAGEKRTFDQIS